MSQPDRLEIQDWMVAAETRQVVAALTAGGGEVRFVGGCVRDALAGRPVNDVDIATPDKPDRVMALLGDAGIKVIPTGLDHGTVTAVAGHKPFEITTLREDVETDGRRAVVAFTDDWMADASRRDLTFNAMSCSPDGHLFDPFGGRADLAAGRVRFVGEPRARIEEDYLRLLRFFRFQAHYGRVRPDEALLEAMTALAPRLRSLSGERLRVEFLKLLAAGDPLPALALMRDHAILPAFLPEAGDLATLKRLLEQGEVGHDDPVMRLAALLPAQRPPATAVADRLRFSGAQTEKLERLADPPPALKAARRGLDASADAEAVRVALRGALYRAGAAAVADDLVLQAARDGSPVDRLQAALGQVVTWTPRRFPLSGSDVLGLGVEAGPRVGDLLEAVEAWWIQRDFAPDRKACLAELERRAGKGAV
ncbi:CCA tRNA nucleotidyltransferase [Pelagibius sp.]|uniref:CCA tRNA nucleotidyltransferase n=1 Tax=Pelagibius sp. TaxID=1931238 RepID=UPI00261DD760|nr:CCA tRNA nucleotidyltransferase [Pelagibius sp.]